MKLVQVHAFLSGQNQGMLIKIFKQRLVFDFWIMNDREGIRKPAWGRGWGEKDGDKEPPGQQPGQDVAVDSKHNADPAPCLVGSENQTRHH